MERELKLLKEKVLELSQENVALREINVQFQLENFKLQQNIKKLESSQLDQVEAVTEEVDDSHYFTFDPTAEYLDDTIRISPPRPSKTRESVRVKAAAKRAYSEAFEYTLVSEVVEEKPTMVIAERISEHGDIKEEPWPDCDDPKEAAKLIFQKAAERGTLNRLEALEGGKQKDSSFVSKVLDLIFDRATLANSSARGQKCQSKLHIPAKPALDPRKLNLCRQAFVYRLKRERLSSPDKDNRLKFFNGYVNFKIQNARKLLKK